MLLLDQIAERRILEAIDTGELDDLAGAGQPLQLVDDSLVPEELRVAWRILKNSGFLPPEMKLRGEIANVETLISQVCITQEKTQLSRRKNFLMMKLEASNPGSVLLMEESYRRKLIGET